MCSGCLQLWPTSLWASRCSNTSLPSGTLPSLLYTGLVWMCECMQSCVYITIPLIACVSAVESWISVVISVLSGNLELFHESSFELFWLMLSSLASYSSFCCMHSLEPCTLPYVAKGSLRLSRQQSEQTATHPLCPALQQAWTSAHWKPRKCTFWVLSLHVMSQCLVQSILPLVVVDNHIWFGMCRYWHVCGSSYYQTNFLSLPIGTLQSAVLCVAVGDSRHNWGWGCAEDRLLL